MRTVREWLSSVFAQWALSIHPEKGRWKDRYEGMGMDTFHVGPGRRCPNDPQWR